MYRPGACRLEPAHRPGSACRPLRPSASAASSDSLPLPQPARHRATPLRPDANALVQLVRPLPSQSASRSLVGSAIQALCRARFHASRSALDQQKVLQTRMSSRQPHLPSCHRPGPQGGGHPGLQIFQLSRRSRAGKTAGPFVAPRIAHPNSGPQERVGRVCLQQRSWTPTRECSPAWLTVNWRKTVQFPENLCAPPQPDAVVARVPEE